MLQEEPLQPLALEPLTEEEQVGLGRSLAGQGAGSPAWREGPKLERQVVEVVVLGRVQGGGGCLGPHSHPWLPPQRNFSLSVNSVAVLRLMGKGAGPPLGGASRGRGSTRSRGRGGDHVFWGRAEVGPMVLRVQRDHRAGFPCAFSTFSRPRPW